ncbi:bacteriohemerythrin [Geomonas propionica]|uniref:Hemerythrin family protein n=1 Tax=Geomonas propionica TaxID=2798582 RepID=A0ABS0YQP4_9BACT|nr:bacteriohemerythrin [Geomonas propionica]MBJ6800269.1 hemerythrin family protein [Geomonas propionica]
MNIEWTTDLAIGVNEIDEQHKEIFRRFDRLLTACNEGKGNEEVLKLLLFLEDYVKEHFAAEEQLQKGSNYPDYPAHKAQHVAFMADVHKLTSSFREEGATLPLVIQTNRTLADWLIRHIKKVDTAFARYLREQ